MNIQEERLVAVLADFGVRYLSRQASVPVRPVRSPARFLADLIQQPSSRVRTAFIAVLLAHPALAQSVPAALTRLKPEEQLTLKLFFTAAVLLQKKYADQLRLFVEEPWQWLPDLYSTEFGLDTGQSPTELLRELGVAHRRQTGITLNWTGTYENVAHHLLHRWEVEQQWNL
jgi:hypothetical protein